MDNFIKVCKESACLFTKKLLTQQVLASCFSTRVNPRYHFIPYYIMSSAEQYTNYLFKPQYLFLIPSNFVAMQYCGF